MSHFVIWRDKILLFGQYEADLDTSPEVDETAHLIDAVREGLPKTELISFSEIADRLDAVPWDVLKLCRGLVRIGFAREGKGKQRGWFGRA
jgi:hypothetical protein